MVKEYTFPGKPEGPNPDGDKDHQKDITPEMEMGPEAQNIKRLIDLLTPLIKQISKIRLINISATYDELISDYTEIEIRGWLTRATESDLTQKPVFYWKLIEALLKKSREHGERKPKLET